MKHLHYITLALITSFLVTGCSEDEENSNSNLKVRLTDSPAEYEAVNIDIQEVQIHYSDAANDTAEWKTLDFAGGVFNLLEFSNGLDTLLVNEQIPSGTLSQIRLVLGDNNTLIIDGETKDLFVPSGSESGLKLNLGAQLTEGITYTVWIDFDASRSVVVRGNEQYNLKPVIRAYMEAQDGGIKGIVRPVESSPVVYAIFGTDTFGTNCNDEGKFMILGLQEGTYKINFIPIVGFSEKIIEDIVVTQGNVTDMDTVIID